MTAFVVVLISTFGLISSIFIFALNSFLISKRGVRKHLNFDLQLFSYRFVLDIFLGLFVAIYLALILIYCFDPSIMNNQSLLIFIVSLPASNIGAMRSIITLSITIDRCVAVYFPIFFHASRRHFPTIFVALFAVLFGLFEDLVLFSTCDFDLKMPENCLAFGCAINSCFRSYWTSHKTTIFAFTGLFSVLLCIKLAFIKNGHKRSAKINRLALLDAITVAIFHFLPSFIARLWGADSFISFQNIGPYGAVAKVFGYAIESYLAARTLLKSQEIFSPKSRILVKI